MKITVKYYKEIDKAQMYNYLLLGATVEIHWENGKAYQIEYWTAGKKRITSIW